MLARASGGEGLHPSTPFLRFLPLLLLLLGAAVSLAENNPQTGLPNNGQVTASGYNPDAQIQTGTRTSFPFIANASLSNAALTVTNLSNPALFPIFTVSGRPNISFSCRFSATAQTCAFRYVAMYRANSTAPLNLLGISPIITITLDTSYAPPTDNTGLYIAPDFIQDSYGANVATLQIVALPASGTLTIGMGSY